jgi:hypothetical protein
MGLNIKKSGVVVQPCNPSTQEDEAGGLKFKASLGYIGRLSQLPPHKKKTKTKQKTGVSVA